VQWTQRETHRERRQWMRRESKHDGLDSFLSSEFHIYHQISWDRECFSSTLPYSSFCVCKPGWSLNQRIQRMHGQCRRARGWSPLDLLHPLVSSPLWASFIWIKSVLQNKSDWCREMMIHHSILGIINILWPQFSDFLEITRLSGTSGFDEGFENCSWGLGFFKAAPCVRVWDLHQMLML
jgi:hypothetical protein